MLEDSGSESSSPLSTVEDIQRRLVRPSSLPSPTPASKIRSRISIEDDLKCRDSSQSQVNLTEIRRETHAEERETMKKIKRKKNNLEDYLDPFLLSAISSKMKGKGEEGEAKLPRDSKDFEWPAEELKAFTENSTTTNGIEWSDVAVVNLNDDRNGDVGENDEEACSPFRRFEESVLKLFKEQG